MSITNIEMKEFSEMNESIPPVRFKEPLKPKYFQFCKRKNNYLINIGPEWYVPLIITLILLPAGIATFILKFPTSHKILKWFFLILIIIFFIISVLIFVKDPGLVQFNHQEPMASQLPKYSHEFQCLHCRSLKSEKSRHCRDCNICVRGWDHHCGFLGRCIGKNNLALFYVYVCLTPLYVIALFIQFIQF